MIKTAYDLMPPEARQRLERLNRLVSLKGTPQWEVVKEMLLCLMGQEYDRIKRAMKPDELVESSIRIRVLDEIFSTVEMASAEMDQIQTVYEAQVKRDFEMTKAMRGRMMSGVGGGV